METKILNVEIQEKGKVIQIKTNRKDNYKFIWLEAEDLKTLADIAGKI